MCVASAVGAVSLGMSWDPPIARLARIPLFLLIAAVAYRLLRPAEFRLFLIPFYIALELTLSIVGTQLTFIANTLNFPLQSETFKAWDTWLGFDWKAWADFMLARPMLKDVLALAYMSLPVQAILAIVIIAFWGPLERNFELIAAKVIALTITIAVSALLPAIEPGYFYGFDTPAAREMLALREGQREGLSYIGILCFPSYHTVLAVLYIWVFRGMPIPLACAIILNAAMLLSIPFAGDHYLVDILAGVAVAFVAQFLATRLVTQRRGESRD